MKYFLLIPIFLLFATAPLLPQVALAPMPYLDAQYSDNSGVPLAAGKLYTYAAGTTTPLATYTTASGGVTNANPTVLDSNGRVSAWLLGQSYHIILKNSDDSVTYFDLDNVPGRQLYGTINTIPMFTSANALGDSHISHSGSTTTVNELLNASAGFTTTSIVATSTVISGVTISGSAITMLTITTPSNPSSGWMIYAGSDGKLKAVNSSGTTKVLAP